ncbi:hypothetical protein [Glycomyces artemisiae]|uniref:Uncharacterized protein n=1 Tax=Glycomyces artemisiae TaxID=1076443 RepID=A0A2T0UIJ4_9ACTN|nr:hypothetical protein [Glycomyces artemisiae]PRY57704.1 hypothetical protein B0I28_106124 [Glycomyces artemisiae]
MTETPEPQQDAADDAPLNREERRALARGKKAGKAGHQSIGDKKSKVRSQMPKGGVGKFQLPTKNG